MIEFHYERMPTRHRLIAISTSTAHSDGRIEGPWRKPSQPVDIYVAGQRYARVANRIMLLADAGKRCSYRSQIEQCSVEVLGASYCHEHGELVRERKAAQDPEIAGIRHAMGALGIDWRL